MRIGRIDLGLARFGQRSWAVGFPCSTGFGKPTTTTAATAGAETERSTPALLLTSP